MRRSVLALTLLTAGAEAASQEGGRNSISQHLGHSAEDIARAVRLPLRWKVRAVLSARSCGTPQRLRSGAAALLAARSNNLAALPHPSSQDPVSGHSWDLQPLMLPGSSYVFRDMMVRPSGAAAGRRSPLSPLTPYPPRLPQTDEEHDSVHAHPEPVSPPPAALKSGRMLDQVKVDKLSTGAAAEGGPPPKRKVSLPVHPYNPDEYDFWVNVGTNVVGAPALCAANNPQAPAYQVVIPREQSEEEMDAADAALAEKKREAAEAGGVGGVPDERDDPRYRKLERQARAPPVPTQCHALGSLKNVSFSVINPKDPGHGVSLTYHGGDNCLKKVMRHGPGTPNKDGTPGPPSTGYLQPEWVPVPRSLSLHIRCDENDTGATDVATFLQLVKRVRVVETEMCEYVVEWPSRWGCSQKGKGHTKSAGQLLSHPSVVRRLVWLVLPALGAWQLKRQWPAIKLLLPALRGGDQGAWRRAASIMVSKNEPIKRRHSKAGHEV